MDECDLCLLLWVSLVYEHHAIGSSILLNFVLQMIGFNKVLVSDESLSKGQLKCVLQRIHRSFQVVKAIVSSRHYIFHGLLGQEVVIGL